MTEHDIQNRIRVALSEWGCTVFRVNVVAGWVGEEHKLRDGSLLLTSPRRIMSGVPPGFSDLVAVLPGGRVAFIECKGPRGRLTREQEHFLARMRECGCRAGIARSVDEAIRIVEGGYEHGGI